VSAVPDDVRELRKQLQQARDENYRYQLLVSRGDKKAMADCISLQEYIRRLHAVNDRHEAANDSLRKEVKRLAAQLALVTAERDLALDELWGLNQ